MAISDNIKRLRLEYNLSQTELGKIAGVTNKAVSAWESGYKVPRMGAIERMAAYFGVKKSEIIDDISSANSEEVSFMATDKPRFSITMDTDTLARVDDYRYSHRISTQSKAILKLVQEGLKQIDSQSQNEKDPKCPTLHASHAEQHLVDNYRALNAEGQEKLMDYSDDLVDTGKYIKNVTRLTWVAKKHKK